MYVVERESRRLAAAKSPNRTGPGPAHGPARGALVVGLDSAAAGVCREVLKSLRFAVQAVDTGVAAVVVARGHIPDVILMDSQLRDVTALEAVAWLRSNSTLKDVPVIIVVDNGASLSASGREGVNALLKKPLSRSAVERAIRSLTPIERCLP